MACNCKKKMVLEDKYGVKEEESILGKLYRYIWKVIMFFIFILMACVLVPVLIFTMVFQLFFKNNVNIALPKFLGKFLK